MKRASGIDSLVKGVRKPVVKPSKSDKPKKVSVKIVSVGKLLTQGMRKPVVNPTEQRKRFLVLAWQLYKNVKLSEEQRLYLADAFERIGNGESADAALKLKRGKGQKARDDESREKISLVFAQVASKIAPVDGAFPGEGMSLVEAMTSITPFVRKLFGVEASEKYSIEYLQKLWNDPSYAHMRSPFRSPFDPDSPFPLSQS